ncbi:MAG: peroxide stress protein YaaA [Pseudomonadota bacterium]
MLIVISPAKKLDFDNAAPTDRATQPEFLDEAGTLIDELRQYDEAGIAKLMKLSDKLAALNTERYRDFTTPFTPQNAKASLFAFKGDVYTGLAAETLPAEALDYTQRHLRILSGLYGVLRPLDLMQPYRLEMGTRLPNRRGKNLYEFWGDTITRTVSKALDDSGDRTLVNLASNEYFKSVDSQSLDARVVTPQFKDRKNGEYKMIGLFAKRARGLMTRYAIDQRIESPEDLKHFDWEGYRYNESLSSENDWVFTRDKKPA